MANSTILGQLFDERCLTRDAGEQIFPHLSPVVVQFRTGNSLAVFRFFGRQSTGDIDLVGGGDFQRLTT